MHFKAYPYFPRQIKIVGITCPIQIQLVNDKLSHHYYSSISNYISEDSTKHNCNYASAR